VLSNKFRVLVGNVASESKSNFVKDRQIFDGILIANESVVMLVGRRKIYLYLSLIGCIWEMLWLK
jgi:hypothetical protein